MLTFSPKKHLGQNFLIDKNIAKKIVNCLSFSGYSTVVEVGPGMGILTQFILDKTKNLFLIEIDNEAIKYLNTKFPCLKNRILHIDFIQWAPILSNFALIGNFPYNISGKILFKLIDLRFCIKECIGMFQKEVAKRITSQYGNKNYGIISVLIQAFYKVEYLFEINEKVFFPPPRVKSAVIRFSRKKLQFKLNKNLFFKIVKTAFNKRRKILKNALKPLTLKKDFYALPILNKRAEQLSVEEFIKLSFQAYKN